MTQKEKIAQLEQRVQVLEQKVSKLIRTERSEPSNGTVKPLQNRRQERLEKSCTAPNYTLGVGGLIGFEPQYAGFNDPKLVSDLLELNNSLSKNGDITLSGTDLKKVLDIKKIMV